jgi:hypothetical protein
MSDCWAWPAPPAASSRQAVASFIPARAGIPKVIARMEKSPVEFFL